MASFPPFYYCHHPSLLQLLFTRKVNFYDNFLSFRVFAYSSFPPHYFFLHTHNPTPRGCLQKRKEWVKPVIHCFYELFIALLNTITFCCINCILKLYVLSGTLPQMMTTISISVSFAWPNTYEVIGQLIPISANVEVGFSIKTICWQIGLASHICFV